MLRTRQVNDLIRVIDWNLLLEETHPEALMNSLVDKMNIILYSNSKIVCKEREKRKRTAWITRELIENCKERDILYRRWKNNPSNSAYETAYKKVRNLVNKKISRTRDQYYKMKFELARGDPRKTWELINKVLG